MRLGRYILQFFIIFFVAFVFFIGGITWALHSGWFLKVAVLKGINPLLKGVTIEQFETGIPSFYFPNQLILKDTALVLRKDHHTYQFGCRYMHLENDSPLFAYLRQLRLHAEDCAAGAPLWGIRGIDFNLRVELMAKKLGHLTGEAKASTIRWEQYHLHHFKTKIEFRDNTFQLKELSADAYGGEIRAGVSIENQPGFPYSLDMAVTGVDLKRIQPTPDNLLSQIRGKVDGRFRLQGRMNEIASLAGDLNMGEGGLMKASWLSFISSHLPPHSIQRRELDRLIKTDGDFPFERLSVEARSLTEEKMASEVKIESKRFNLNLDYTMDTTIEGGLSNFLSSLGIFSR